MLPIFLLVLVLKCEKKTWMF